MLVVLVVMALAVVLAAIVVLYAAFPYRGEETPVSPRLGRALRSGVDRLPTIDTGAAARAETAELTRGG